MCVCVAQPYFVSPSGFWAGTQQHYLDLYAATARAVKGVSLDYRVGYRGNEGGEYRPAQHDNN